MAELRTVWILGAGFSAPLGAPLLGDLFSERMREEALLRVAASEKVLKSPCARVVCALYRYGLGDDTEHALPGLPVFAQQDEPPRLRGRKYWRNAEEYLEFLDAAEADVNSFAGRRLTAVLDSWDAAVAPIRRRTKAPHPREDPTGAPTTAYYANVQKRAEGRDSFVPAWEELTCKDLADTARRIVAIECASFIADADIKTERWIPYRRWQRSRSLADTIISFNYDRVIETLLEQIPNLGTSETPKMRVRLPNDLAETGVRVLKLHGSIDWRMDGDRLVRTNALDFLDPSGPPPAIATPGNSKHAASKGPFKPLWDAAVQAIKAAERIYFVGYRFPESDAYSRSTILDVIRESEVLNVQVVLGLQSRDAGRLAQLVTLAKPRATVTVLDLWSQDFLDRTGH
jgi:hypothetical protein